MVRLDRIEFVKLLVSVGAGIVAGSFARGWFGDQMIGIFATVAVLIIVYTGLDIADRRYRRTGEM